MLYLEKLLNQDNGSYADSFKSEIMLYFEGLRNNDGSYEFVEFIDKCLNNEDVEKWLSNLLSQIVLKFDSEQEQLFEFIHEFTL